MVIKNLESIYYSYIDKLYKNKHISGLPSYVQARQIALGSPQPTSFDDLRTTHSAEVYEVLI